MKLEITKEQQANYMDDPDACPVCGSYHITAGETFHETWDAFRIITCLDCNHEWEELFQLTQICNLVNLNDTQE
jgi:formate dehydrogenase maturation protein FdhE